MPSRRYLKICLGVAILGSLLLLPLEKTPHSVVKTFLIIDRALVTSLLIFVSMLTAFLVYYAIPFNRNLVVYSMGVCRLLHGQGKRAFSNEHYLCLGSPNRRRRGWRIDDLNAVLAVWAEPPV